MKYKFKNFLIILILLISVSSVILPIPLNNLDEIWNYNFARCIKNGLLPYKDFNMVQTPLLPIINGIFLKLTFDELIVMRILAVILTTLILFTIYKIFEILDINSYIINISVITIFILLYKFLCIDYNYSVLLITLITICFEIKNKKDRIIESNHKKDFILGILVGTSILFKQTTGLALLLIFIFYKILLVKNKKDFKIVFKTIIYRLLGVLIPIILLVLYLTINNIWKDFLDYTVYSLKTFSNKISYINLLNGNYGIIVQLLSIAIPITVLIMYYQSVYKKHTGKEQENIFILFSYSVASLVIIFPISDSIHFLIGSIPTIIALIYMIYISLKKIINKQPKSKQIKYELKCFMKVFGYLSIIAIIAFSIYNIVKYIRVASNYTELSHFRFIPYKSDIIKKIDDYILEKNKDGKNVYILDASAAIYMIPINKYNKDYDMFLKGNLGACGEERTNRKT